MSDLRCQLHELCPLGLFCPVTSPVFSASFPVSLHHPCRLLHQAALGPCPSGTNTDGTEFCGRKSSQSCFSWHCFVLYRGLNWAFKGPSNSSELLLQFPLLPGSGLSDPNNRTHPGRQLRQELLRLRPWSAQSHLLWPLPCSPSLAVPMEEVASFCPWLTPSFTPSKIWVLFSPTFPGTFPCWSYHLIVHIFILSPWGSFLTDTDKCKPFLKTDWQRNHLIHPPSPSSYHP